MEPVPLVEQDALRALEDDPLASQDLRQVLFVGEADRLCERPVGGQAVLDRGPQLSDGQPELTGEPGP